MFRPSNSRSADVNFTWCQSKARDQMTFGGFDIKRANPVVKLTRGVHAIAIMAINYKPNILAHGLCNTMVEE